MLQVVISCLLALVLAAIVRLWSVQRGTTRPSGHALECDFQKRTGDTILPWPTTDPHRTLAVDFLTLTAREITELLDNGTLTSVQLGHLCRFCSYAVPILFVYPET